jgi:hypothetical protein
VQRIKGENEMKTSELTGAALDWAVAKCESLDCYIEDGVVHLKGQPFDTDWRYWLPSTDWAQGGPLIERELISLDCQFDVNEWYAWTPAPEQETGEARARGDTPLIAAMRCYVASKLGDEVEIPKELT